MNRVNVRNLMRINNINGKNIMMFMIALTILALGISIYINTNVGVGAWDILHGNLFEYYGLTFGTWVIIVGIITITVSQLFYFNLRSYLSVITGLIFGVIIDLWSALWVYTGVTETFAAPILQWIFFLVALIFLGSGIALLVLSQLPPTPIDVLMIGYMNRFKLNFNVAKFLTEFTAFTAAIIVGFINDNPFRGVYFGTIIALFSIGIIVQYSTIVWKKLFKITI